MDKAVAKKTSYRMSQIKSKDTKAELAFRGYIWKKGIRGYRVKNKILGRPDLYFPKKKLAIFIDGCFWHKCPICYRKPKNNRLYWEKKISRNVQRDKRIDKELKRQGFLVLRFWEHEVNKNIQGCYERVLEGLTSRV